MIKTIELYTILKDKLGERETQALVDVIESIPKESLASKEDIAKLETKIAELESKLIKWVVGTGIAIVGALKLFILK
jgi:hypothetical protein